MKAISHQKILHSKNICFIFPHPPSGPTGGYKVVYEYANRLAKDGFDVKIAYSGSVFWKKKPFKFKITNIYRYFETFLKGYSSRKWFPLDKRIGEVFPFSMNYRHIPKADIYFATSPYTAWYLNKYPIESERKFYLIQDKEDWGSGLKAILKSTYKMPLQKIVVSKWLWRMLKNEYKEESVLIPNGFDFNKFKLTIPIDKKDKYSISILYHNMERKRCEDAISALKLVKGKIPQLRVKAFGVPQSPANLPEWIEYYQQPDDETHNRINNECAIYIGSSENEGWGLTVGEAMICGQAVCCTDNEGYREMAIDGKTALLSPVRDPKALADNIIKLIEDDDLRIKIAKNGNKYIRSFTWDKSYLKFKQILLDTQHETCYF